MGSESANEEGPGEGSSGSAPPLAKDTAGEPPASNEGRDTEEPENVI